MTRMERKLQGLFLLIRGIREIRGFSFLCPASQWKGRTTDYADDTDGKKDRTDLTFVSVQSAV